MSAAAVARRAGASSPARRGGRAWCLGLTATVLCSGCTTLRGTLGTEVPLNNPPRLHDEVSAQKDAKDAAQRQIDAYYAALKAAEQGPDSTKLAKYVDEGIGLVDSHCLRWFQRLDDYERDVQFRGKETNVITQLGTALIGAARLHPDVTTLYGAGTTAVAGLRSNRLEGLVIAPAAKGVKAKVMTVMAQRAGQLRAVPPATLPQARGQLEAYADLCTYSSAKSLVDKSVDAAQPAVSPSGEFRIVSEGTFGTDDAKIALRQRWKPRAGITDRKAEAKLQAWLERNAGGVSIPTFLNDAAYASLRSRALNEIDFNSP